MNMTGWKDTAELIGITAIIASLFFVGVQLKQDRAMALANGITEQTSIYQSYAELVNDNATTWEKGLSGAELSESEALGFQALANAYEMLFVASFERSRLIGGNPSKRYATQWAFQLYRNPGLILHWQNGARDLDAVHELSGYADLSASPADSVWRDAVNVQLELIQDRNQNGRKSSDK